MAASFTFLSTDEFERLSYGDRLAYLSDAMEELERVKVPRPVRGWDSLFSQPQQQQQSQPSPQLHLGGDPEPPSS